MKMSSSSSSSFNYNHYNNNEYNNNNNNSDYEEYDTIKSFEPLKPLEGEEISVIQLSNGVEIAHIIGKDGRSKRKISKLANVRIQLLDKLGYKEMNICGTPENIERAKKYIRVVGGQVNYNAVLTPEEVSNHDDTTLIRVPTECAYVKTGTVPTLSISPRELEKEHNVIIGTVTAENVPTAPGESTLAIFGRRNDRRRTEFAIMRIIETKRKGFYTSNVKPHIDPPECDWGTDIIDIGVDASYAQGKRGVTRKKIEAAADCVLGIVGTMAFITGNGRCRKACRDYIGWVTSQKTVKNMDVPDLENRDDVDIVPVPAECMGYVAGKDGRSLYSVEVRTKTFCFISRRECRDDKSGCGINNGCENCNESDGKSVLVFSTNELNRRKARWIIENTVRKKISRDTISIRKFCDDYNKYGDDESKSDSERDDDDDDDDYRRDDEMKTPLSPP